MRFVNLSRATIALATALGISLPFVSRLQGQKFVGDECNGRKRVWLLPKTANMHLRGSHACLSILFILVSITPRVYLAFALRPDYQSRHRCLRRNYSWWRDFAEDASRNVLAVSVGYAADLTGSRPSFCWLFCCSPDWQISTTRIHEHGWDDILT